MSERNLPGGVMLVTDHLTEIAKKDEEITALQAEVNEAKDNQLKKAKDIVAQILEWVFEGDMEARDYAEKVIVLQARIKELIFILLSHGIISRGWAADYLGLNRVDLDD